MKKLLIVFFAVLIWLTPCMARDFILDFVKENYREAKAPFSNYPVIYHSIQVNCIAGPKLLILTGQNNIYRKWLRFYISRNSRIIAKIPDNKADEFIASKAFKVDVENLFPFDGKKWVARNAENPDKNMVTGTDHVLILDSNDKRIQMIKNIVTKMGFQPSVFTAGRQALETFRLHPDKFKLIITRHNLNGMPSDVFVKQILKINPAVPVIIGTGYHKSDVKNKFMSEFSGFKSVHIKPVILQNLESTIETLAGKRA